ncbi:MAG: acyloxyacyl hydrolase [Candidatus Pacebacteria bacterium]|nr:acyloxyacyl hydrolase [Candidatus Paceibacterota bacterium]
MKKNGMLCGMIVAVCLFAVFDGTTTSAAEEGGILKEIAVLSGYSHSNLEGCSDDYEVIPFIVRYSYDPNDLLTRFGVTLPGMWRFNLEPFFGQVIDPAPNVEAGCAFLLRFNVPLAQDRFRLFVEGGAGPMYLGRNTEEQSTHFNFINYAGAGCSVKIKDDLAVEGSFRLRHVSNAGIDHPNSGIDGGTVLLGLNWLF